MVKYPAACCGKKSQEHALGFNTILFSAEIEVDDYPLARLLNNPRQL